ncbi:MAG: glyoxalase [Corynebacteriales bacterium]|nr:glyoxalase [Mycobacteriales bacterium]
MTNDAVSSVWPILHYDDTHSALSYFVNVLGFQQIIAAEDEHGDIGHAELAWPGGGRFVFGSTKHTESIHGHMRPGNNAMYVITDDVDSVYQRVLEYKGEIVHAPRETQFGSGAQAYTFTTRDPEGNLWTFGMPLDSRSS